MQNRDSVQSSKVKVQVTPPAPASATFLARFGQVIVRHGVAAIPAALYHYQGELLLSAQEVWFISSVLSHKWTEDMPHPNLKRMERETGVQERTLRRYKQRLCASGLLIVHPRYDESKRQDSNYYDFSPLFSQIRDLIRAEARQSNPISADGPGGQDTSDYREDDELDDRAGPGMSFMARYGAAIVSRGIAAVPQAIFTYGGDLQLTPQQCWFICYIFSVPWSPPYPYPSIIKMSARTGYSKMQLHEIKNSLVERGYLRLIHRTKSDGGQDSNGYDFAGLFEALRERLRERSEGGRGTPSNSPNPTVQEPPPAPQRPARQGSAAARIGAAKRNPSPDEESKAGKGLREGADRGLTGVGVNLDLREGDSWLTGVGDNKLSGEADTGLTEEAGRGLTTPVKSGTATRLSRALRGRGSQSGHESEPSLEEDKRDDSNQISLVSEEKERTKHPQGSRKFSPYIAAIVTDFSDELGDSTHVTANVGQALRVYAKSGMDEQDFAQLLFQARKTVRARQGQQGLGTINNKMAYFFVVLRDLERQATEGSKD